MAIINAGNLTLLDWTKRRDPSGAHARIAEILTKQSAILEDIPWVEGNLPTGHRVTTRTGLPTPTWRRLNEGVAPSKSKTAQFDESTGMLEGLSVVDVDLAKLNGDEAAFRAGEDLAQRQAQTNELETGLFYHSTKTAPEKIMGLAPRLDSTTGPGGSQIILHDASASGSDQTSVWLVGWAPRKVYGIFPKGSVAGLEHKDLGKQLWDDGTGKKFEAYVTKMQWKPGLAVEDFRYLVRIANIDTGNLLATGNALIQSMVKAAEMLQDLNCTPVYYGNRKISSFLRLQALDTTKNSTISFETVGGKRVMQIGEIPFRRTDALLNTEAPIS